MSNIIEELRTSKRQSVEKTDASRRHGSTDADDNNNNNDDSAPMSSSPGRLWTAWNPALTPTSSAAPRRTGHGGPSRRRRRRSGAAEPCYDECGALDLTAAAKAARPSSNAAARRPPVSATTMTAVTDDSVPLDLTVRRHLPYVVCSSGY